MTVEDLQKDLCTGARAVARAGLAHAYGHCSSRIDEETFLVTPAMPLGHIASHNECVRVRLDEPLPDNVLGEVRIHREIYRARADVRAITRTMPPNCMVLAAYGVVPQPRHGFGSYFYPAPAFWDDPQLLRSDEAAAQLAETLADRRAILMRGNGAVVAASNIREAVVLTWYLEDMARVELAGRSAGLEKGAALSEEDCTKRSVWGGGILDRMWEYLIHNDAGAD